MTETTQTVMPPIKILLVDDEPSYSLYAIKAACSGYRKKATLFPRYGADTPDKTKEREVAR
jgi:hypothetical protein